MSRVSVGVVEFSDLPLKVKTQIIVTRIPGENQTNIFLNQGGDVEVGLDRENAELLLEIVQKAIAGALNESLWHSVGKAEFSWSDHADESESGEDEGTVSIESNGSATRITFLSTKWNWAPCVTHFSCDKPH